MTNCAVGLLVNGHHHTTKYQKARRWNRVFEQRAPIPVYQRSVIDIVANGLGIVVMERSRGKAPKGAVGYCPGNRRAIRNPGFEQGRSLAAETYARPGTGAGPVKLFGRARIETRQIMKQF